jgi:predicted dithiol-disulfide oxidoreductase (DUF899 family)
MSNTAQEILKLEQEALEISTKLQKLRKDNVAVEVKNYKLNDLSGEVSLLDLFGSKDKLFVVHNMGQGCRYCTLWADGFNGFLPHLEDKYAFVLLSKDAPEDQRRFANSRGWRFRMASHGSDSEYVKEQSARADGEGYDPGIICYEKRGNKIFKKNFSGFGPGDQFCSFWSILSLVGSDMENFTAQFNYWQRPQKLDDGGQGVIG